MRPPAYIAAPVTATMTTSAIDAVTTPIAAMAAISNPTVDPWPAVPQVPLLVAGRWRTSAEELTVRDPDDRAPFARVAAAGADEVAYAVREALLASLPARRPSPAERARVLRRAADMLEARMELFAQAIATEGVKTIGEARREAARAAHTLRLSAAACARPRLSSAPDAPSEQLEGGLRGTVLRQPVGVVAAITPFNDPLNLVAHKVGPALATGNAVIVKPHDATPLSALMLAQLLGDSGLPRGLVSVLPGGADVGEALVTDPNVRLVSFTGGQAVGEHIQRSAGIKRLVLELGGICPTIVFEDADPALVAPAVVDGAFAAAGQNCVHVQRLLVHKTRYAALRERLLALTEDLRLGPKLSEATDMGPLIDDAAVARVTGMVQDAVDRGARLLCGGHPVGTSFAPTLLEAVPGAARVAREEVFGPVTVLEEFDTVEDAIDLANRTGGGIHAGVFTGRRDVIEELVERLDVGGVVVGGTSDRRSDALPFGGTGRAGVGREGVEAAVTEMTEPKTILTVS